MLDIGANDGILISSEDQFRYCILNVVKDVIKMSITLEAVRLVQNGKHLYAGKMRSADALAQSEVDVYRPEEEGEPGYQRPPERARGLSMAKYLHESQLVPTSLLLSFRGNLGNRVAQVAGDHVKITFEPEDILWRVDGQHRLLGIEIAMEDLPELAELDLPCVLMENFSEEEEADQFRIINDSSKKVRTDLARRLLVKHARKHGNESAIRAGKLWEVRASEITTFLAKQANSPWSGTIQPPGERKKPQHVVKELSFSNSLKPLVSTTSPLRNWSTEKIQKALLEYWRAWQSLISPGFATPGDYVIMKTPGVFSLHEVFLYVVDYCVHKGLELSEAQFREVLSNAGDWASPELWRADNVHGAAAFGSMKGFGIIADLIREELQANGVDIE